MPGETSSAAGSGSFYDPNALPADQGALPVAPAGQNGPSGATLPEMNSIVLSYAGQVVPVLVLPDGIRPGAPLAEGQVFAVSSGGGIAAVSTNGELIVNNTPMTVSPASQYGTHPNLIYGDVAWSPDGSRLAFRVDALNPAEFNGIDSGVWIFEPATNRSWQVFRNTYNGAQLHEQRRALRVTWAPNGTALAVTVETPLGLGTVFLATDHDANQWVDAIPYADAAWTPDSSALIVSGRTWQGTSVVGRIALDQNWSYLEFLSQQTSRLYTQAATQLQDGRVAFLGSPDSSSFALYAIAAVPAAQPVALSRLIDGQVISAEWNNTRTAVLVTALSGSQTRLWILRTDGVVTNSTIDTGVINAAHWR